MGVLGPGWCRAVLARGSVPSSISPRWKAGHVQLPARRQQCQGRAQLSGAAPGCLISSWLRLSSTFGARDGLRGEDFQHRAGLPAGAIPGWDVAVGSSAQGCCSPSLPFNSLRREADSTRLLASCSWGSDTARAGGAGRGSCAGLPEGLDRGGPGGWRDAGMGMVAPCRSVRPVGCWASWLLRRGHRRAPRRGWGELRPTPWPRGPAAPAQSCTLPCCEAPALLPACVRKLWPCPRGRQGGQALGISPWEEPPLLPGASGGEHGCTKRWL